jgi:hypothetical protein
LYQEDAHLYRNASSGLSRDARSDGYSPVKNPMQVETMRTVE